VDSSGNVLDTCLETDAHCRAECQCFSSSYSSSSSIIYYGGKDCSQSYDELALRSDLRLQMCRALLNVTDSLDPSPQLVVSLATSLGQSYDPSEAVDEQLHEVCSEALTALSDLMALGYLKSAGLSAAMIVADTISKFVKSGINGTIASSATSSPTSSPTSTAAADAAAGKASAVLDAISSLESGLLSLMVCM
jgi:hypothetical protein